MHMQLTSLKFSVRTDLSTGSASRPVLLNQGLTGSEHVDDADLTVLHLNVNVRVIMDQHVF